jgi:hypothetical protein
MILDPVTRHGFAEHLARVVPPAVFHREEAGQVGGGWKKRGRDRDMSNFTANLAVMEGIWGYQIFLFS